MTTAPDLELRDSLADSLADRLLRSSARLNYDPEVDIAWDEPLVPGLWGMPPERLSLYGTGLWDRMPEDDRVRYSWHETASVASVGIWFEVLLMQMMLRGVYAEDPRRQRVHYALTEIADECRHSTMFGKAIATMGVPAYGPVAAVHRLGRLFNLVASGPSAYASILVAEEILDTWQREVMRDERVQPLVRMVSRIHVTEEARHMTFARDEVTRTFPHLTTTARLWHQTVCAQICVMVARSLVNPQVYASVGIDPREGRRAALGNPYYRETLGWMGAKPVAWLREVGMIDPRHEKAWRASLLLG
ncbi:MAG: AurF N-oxygenase family protein [Marmoricola sp.]